ncbi:hypothetical protein HBI18_242650 [Parastagonospora nodorum]|nr:hypothetical protein HBI18_242650 [Parastagonospora nodorum]
MPYKIEYIASLGNVKCNLSHKWVQLLSSLAVDFVGRDQTKKWSDSDITSAWGPDFAGVAPLCDVNSTGHQCMRAHARTTSQRPVKIGIDNAQASLHRSPRSGADVVITPKSNYVTLCGYTSQSRLPSQAVLRKLGEKRKHRRELSLKVDSGQLFIIFRVHFRRTQINMRTQVLYRNHIVKIKDHCSHGWKTIQKCWSTMKELWKKVKNFIGLGKQTRPRSSTVLLSLLGLLVFLVIAIIAIVLPTTPVKYFVIASNTAIVVVLCGTFALDIATNKNTDENDKTKRSIVNTVVTISLTIVVLTALYGCLWHKGLNAVVVRQQIDRVGTSRFPAIAFFQRQDPGHANIHDGEFKCSSGPRNDHAIQCSSLTIAEAMNTKSCDCGDSWSSLESRIMEENKMVWLGKNTSYFAMVPGPTTISRGVGHIMEIQLWFSYNTTEAYEAGSLTPAPGIWMVIYDPEFDIKQMVADGQVYTSLFDANSHTAVSIGLVQYIYINKTSNYRYVFSKQSIRRNDDWTGR